MSKEDEAIQENSTEETEDYTLIEELTEDQPEALPVILNDDQGNELQAILLGDHELLGATLAAVTLPDGSQGFLVNHRASSDEEIKEEADISPRSMLIRDSSTLEPKMVRLEVSPLAASQPCTSESPKQPDSIYAEIQIINGSAVMVARPKPIFEKTKKKESKSNVELSSECRAKFPCPREGCSKVYTTPHHLKVHERSHTGQRPYECDFPRCNKSFSTGYSLKAHQRTHTGEKPYKCTAAGCEKSFKTSGDLLKHYRTHTGERPFVCLFEGCDRAFTTSNIRKVHMRTHTGERPYKCEECNKAFASATNYKNHMRIHSQEKPYICMVENCGRSFTEYSSLYKHRLVHTAAKPFECKLCQKSYRQHSTLIMHKRTVHALVESEDGDDVYLDIEEIEEDEEEEVEKGTETAVEEEEVEDNETQILLVGDAKQLAALQQINLEEDFHNSPIDTSLEGLNIKIEGMEFGWN